MVPRITALLALLPLTAAWPQVMEMNERMKKREEPAPRDPIFKSGRPITGLLPGLTFSAQEQFINIIREVATSSLLQGLVIFVDNVQA
jgi:hypothetical protein